MLRWRESGGHRRSVEAKRSRPSDHDTLLVHGSLDDVRAIPGFVDVLARLSGRPAADLDGEGLRDALAAVEDLSVESDGWAGFRTWRGDGAPEADAPVVLRVARRLVAGCVTAPSRRLQRREVDPFDRALRDDPRFAAAAAAIRRRMAPRCLVFPEGAPLRAAHVQYGEPRSAFASPRLAIVTVLRRDGRIATRVLPIKALEGGEHEDEDATRITADAVLAHWTETWTRGADLAPRHYDERRRANWALADRRLRETVLGAPAAPDVRPFEVMEVEAQAAVRAFCRHLAPEVRAALGLMETIWHRPNIVTMQTIANDIAGRRHPERFAQAFRAAPYLAYLTTRPGEGEAPAWIAADIADAIDAGRAPAEIVRALCRPESRRPVRGFDVKAVMALNDGLERGVTLGHVLQILGDAFPETHRRAPPSPRDLAALVHAVCDICAGTGAWAASTPRIAACLTRGGTISPLPRDCVDAFRWVSLQAFRVGLDTAAAHAAALDAFFPAGGKRPRLEALNARWHRAAERLWAEEEAVRFEHLASLARDLDPAALFPPPPTFDMPAGLQVEVLASSERCRREGAEMRHCVASYRDHAAAGSILLLSIRDVARRSTASLRVGDGRVMLGQVRGPANATPPAAHLAFAQTLAADLDRTLASPTPAGACWRAALAAAAAAAAAVEAIERGAAAAPALADARFELMRPFLPRVERTMARSAWIDHRVKVATA